MASEIRQFQVTIPHGTQVAANWTQPLTFPPRIVERITVLVPPGPRGMMGFAIGAAGVPVLPVNQGAWIVTDDDKIDWPLEDQIDSGAWQLFGYNTGAYDHTIYLTFQLRPVVTGSPAPLQPLSAGQLSN